MVLFGFSRIRVRRVRHCWIETLNCWEFCLLLLRPHLCQLLESGEVLEPF